LVAAEPVLDLINFVQKSIFVALVDFGLWIIDGVFDIGAVPFK